MRSRARGGESSDEPATWADALRQYERARTAPSSSSSAVAREPVRYVTQYEMTRRQREFDPVVQRWRDEAREMREEEHMRASRSRALADARRTQINGEATYDIVSNEPKIVAGAGSGAEEEPSDLADPQALAQTRARRRAAAMSGGAPARRNAAYLPHAGDAAPRSPTEEIRLKATVRPFNIVSNLEATSHITGVDQRVLAEVRRAQQRARRRAAAAETGDGSGTEGGGAGGDRVVTRVLPAFTRPREFNMVSNQYVADHRTRAQQDELARRAQALAKLEATRQFDVVRQIYVDAQRDAVEHEREQREFEARQQRAQRVVERLPTVAAAPSAAYDIVTAAPRNEARMRSLVERDDRPSRTVFPDMPARQSEALDQRATLEDTRRLNRVSERKFLETQSRGFDVVSNKTFGALDGVPRPPPPRTRPPLPTWERVTLTSANPELVSATLGGASSLPSSAAPSANAEAPSAAIAAAVSAATRRPQTGGVASSWTR